MEKIIYISSTEQIMKRDLQILNFLSKKYEIILFIIQKKNSPYKNFGELKYEKIHIRKSWNLHTIKVFMSLSKKSRCVYFSNAKFYTIAYLSYLLHKTKMIYNYHAYPISTAGDLIKEKLSFLKRKHIIFFLTKIENFFLKRTFLVLLTPLEKKESQRVCSQAQNNITLKNYPEINEKAIMLSQYKSLYEKRFMIYAGTIASYTGIELYLDIVKHLKKNSIDLSLIILGKVSEMKEYDLRKRIADMQLSDSVFYLGWLPYNVILSFIDRAVLGLALFDPSHNKFKRINDGTSRKVYTYMSRAVPIISNGPLGSVLQKENCGLKIEYNAQALYTGVISILGDKKLHRELSSNAKVAFKKKYSWDIEEDKIYNFIKKYDR